MPITEKEMEELLESEMSAALEQDKEIDETWETIMQEQGI